MTAAGAPPERASGRAELAARWRRFGQQECRGYSPLYERVCEAVAGDDDVLDLVLDAPPPGRQPNVLLAAVHDLVLRGLDHPLAAVYDTGAAPADAGRLFCEVVHHHRREVASLLATRRTNTNECGRSAVLVPALRWFADQVDRPLALLDAGASAGLNLHLDRYLLDYGDAGTTGPSDAPVRIPCELTGPAPIAADAPEVVARVGLDRAPVDLEDAAEVRWLLACVWPDTGRLPRTRAAIDLARRHRVPVVRGDVATALPAAAALLPGDAALAVTTSWVMAYVRREDHGRVVDALAGLSARRPVAWISAEAPGVLADVAATDDRGHGGVTRSVLAAMLFDEGARTSVHVLGRCHPHGATLEWLPSP